MIAYTSGHWALAAVAIVLAVALLVLALRGQRREES
jgi:hypothetical protein